MKRGLTGSILLAALLGLAALVLLSCATQSGSTLRSVAAVESAGENAPETTPVKVPESAKNKKGLEVVSSPSRAEVWLDNAFQGQTPLLLEGIHRGRHFLRISLPGYYEVGRWVDFYGTYVLYEVTLLPVTGFLSLALQPPESVATVGGNRVPQGISELPVGSYPLVVRAFGYGDYRDTVTVFERSMTTVDVSLVPMAFTFTRASALRDTVNPDNPGVLGSFEVSFSVSGPGTAEAEVLDADGRTVFASSLLPFTTWDQSFRWNCRDREGRPVPDGAYTFRLTGRGPASVDDVRADISLAIDRTHRTAPRALWSGAAGLLYAPTADVLPSGGFQVSFLAAVFSDGLTLRAPAVLGARFGLKGGLELDAAADLIVAGDHAPFGASVSSRYALLEPGGSFGFGAALQAGFSAQYDPPDGVLLSDTFANFSAISLGVPLELAAGPLRLLLSPSVAASLWTPMAGSRNPAFTGWMYLRAGLLLDFGQVVAGVSASARTLPFAAGFPGLGLPVQAGAEMHWLIPNTHLLVSGILASEIESASDFYLMGGAGLGFLY
jgi:hypothetical protein